MRASVLFFVLAGIAAASPVEPRDDGKVPSDFANLDPRAFKLPQPRATQTGSGATTSNDLLYGFCQSVTLIWARGSEEEGNMGTLGPGVCAGLKAKYNNKVACQGVGAGYSGNIQDALLPKGTTDSAIGAGLSMINLAFWKCPKTQVVFGGYSQGSMVMSYAVQALPEQFENKLKGGIFFGYPKNKETGGKIPGFPSNKLKVFCRSDDVVCFGIKNITEGHFKYGPDVPTGVSFLASLIGFIGWW